MNSALGIIMKYENNAYDGTDTDDARFMNWLTLKFKNHWKLSSATKNALWNFWEKGYDNDKLDYDEESSDDECNNGDHRPFFDHHQNDNTMWCRKTKWSEKRKTDQKSAKDKTAKIVEEIVPQPTSCSLSQSASTSLRKNDSFDNGATSGASSTSTIDQVDLDFLMMDFSWPDWSPLFEIDAPRMDGRDELNMPFDSLDQFLMKNDESEILEKLYDECLQLIDGVYARDYMQKAKIQWAIEGDENSNFFHGIINRKRANLAIKGVMVDGD
ncbi:hypothetical protein Tco_1220548 [Tanacetum coccineum]